MDALERAAFQTVTEAERLEAARIVQRMVRNSIILSLIAMLILIPMSRIIILVLTTPEFLGATTPLRILLLGLPFVSSTRPLAMYITGQLGKPHISSLLSWFAVPVAFGLFHYLAPRYGLPGAAAALVGTQAFLFLVFFIVFIRKTGLVRPADYLIPKPEDFRSFTRTFQHFLGKGA